MKHNRTDKWFLNISICGFVLMSVSFLLMPMNVGNILPGACFWGGLLLGIVFQIVLEVRRRSFFSRYQINRKSMQKPRNGLLTFASNKAAAVVDNIFVVAIVATVVLFILTKGTGYLCYVGISATLLTFCLHCILNGRNYFHATNKNRVRQVLESKTETTTEKGEGKK